MTVHTIAMATDVTDTTFIESEVKISMVDSEENSKDFKLDLFVSHYTVHTLLQIKRPILSVALSNSDAYLRSPFKPPRT